VDPKSGAEHELWNKRWNDGQTGFHEGAPNALLAAHVARIEERKPRARILVPLSGKSVDLRWLADRGHDVVGVEFVERAILAFFEEQKLTPVASKIGDAPAFQAGRVTLVCGDFFEVASSPELGEFDVVFDRAALVAIEPTLRARYVEACRARLADGGVTFLVAFAYDQSRAPGPPWSVPADVVRELYAPFSASIEELETRAAPANPRLIAAGIPALMETAYLIRT
jgi:thiopurine S-methyltransferase